MFLFGYCSSHQICEQSHKHHSKNNNPKNNLTNMLFHFFIATVFTKSHTGLKQLEKC